MGVQLHLCIDKSAVISRGESNLKGLVVVALGVLQEVVGELEIPELSAAAGIAAVMNDRLGDPNPGRVRVIVCGTGVDGFE